MKSLPLAVAVLWWCAHPALAQVCRAMDVSAVSVDTGTSDLLPQRCDEPGKCQLFTLDGRQAGATGDFEIAGTASPGGLVGVGVRATGREGFITLAGTWKIAPKYKHVGPFCEDRAAVERADGLWMYIDRDGKQVGDSWDGAEPLTEGRGLVTIRQGGDTYLHGFVDGTGKLVVAATFEGARLFSDGRAAVLVNGKWGYIDRDGKVVVEPRFADAQPYHAGRAVVRTSSEWGENRGLIDQSGTFVVSPHFERIVEIYGAGLWAVGHVDPSYHGDGEPPILSRIVDAEGHFVSPDAYHSVSDPSEGLVAVCRDDACGFIDLQAKTVVPLRFKYVEDFHEGLAAVTPTGERYGFIDRSGKFVIEPRYDSLGPNGGLMNAGPFVDGLAPAGCHGHWGFIDKTGAWAIPPVYRLTRAFANGFAEVQIKTGTGHIRRDGSAIDFAAREVDQPTLGDEPCGARVIPSKPR